MKRPSHYCYDQWAAANTHGSSSCSVGAMLSSPLSLTKITCLPWLLLGLERDSESFSTHYTGQSQAELGKIYFPFQSTAIINNETE